MGKWTSSGHRAADAGDISTLLSKDTEIRGSIKSQGSIRIDGSVCGDVFSAKTVTIGATGSVEGNITGDDIIVAGKVKGTLTSRGRVALESSAQIEGDLNTSRLSIAEGAMFRGLSNMGGARPPARNMESKTDEAAAQPRDRVVAA